MERSLGVALRREVQARRELPEGERGAAAGGAAQGQGPPATHVGIHRAADRAAGGDDTHSDPLARAPGLHRKATVDRRRECSTKRRRAAGNPSVRLGWNRMVHESSDAAEQALESDGEKQLLERQTVAASVSDQRAAGYDGGREREPGFEGQEPFREVESRRIPDALGYPDRGADRPAYPRRPPWRGRGEAKHRRLDRRHPRSLEPTCRAEAFREDFPGP